jgi:hypothetical protein
VDANEVLEGLFEPGDHYWKQEGGHIRALNIANMMKYVIKVIKEYLENRAATSVSGYRSVESCGDGIPSHGLGKAEVHAVLQKGGSTTYL